MYFHIFMEANFIFLHKKMYIKNFIIMKKSIVLIAFLLIGFLINAQEKYINYKGLLSDNNGPLANTMLL